MKMSDWLSERILFGSFIIVGYIAICVIGMTAPISGVGESVVHDAMLGLGPIVGIIAQAIWKTDKTDKQQSDTLSTLANVVAAQSPQSPK